MRTHVNATAVAPPLETASDCSQEDSPDTRVVPTHFYLTGFNRFFNVSVNPTQLIVDALPAFLDANPLPSQAKVCLTSVFKVSANDIRPELEAMYRSLSFPQTGKDAPPQPAKVFVHLGVNMRTTRFQLELQACNEATFSCPDEAGWRPVRAPIDPLNADISSIARSSLDIPRLVTDLSARGFDVEQSSDAGRFVCNWTYYKSLQLAAAAGAHVLFVHVPPAIVIPIDGQVRFTAALLDSIAASDFATVKAPYVSS